MRVVYKRIVIGILIILLISVAYCINLLVKTNYIPIQGSDDALGIEDNGMNSYSNNAITDRISNDTGEDVVSIALFGLDRTIRSENGRSDSIMIFTIDSRKKRIKMSSIMRDLLVPIEGHRDDKINHAYSFGGPQLAVKTLNQNFGTNIRHFAAIDYVSLVKAINEIDGIMIEIKNDELFYINQWLDQSQKLNESGMQLLNGKQTEAFVRMRNLGRGDFDRTERQFKVLSAIVNRIKVDGLSGLPGNASRILPYVDTNMDISTILYMGANCFANDISQFEYQRFPMDGYWKSINLAGIYYLKSDLSLTRKQITEYIHEDI